ncbi:LysM peptidoglycan-binding domain-containing protein [Verrucomicrobiales bacterium]|nr:LysM peptidoglycan-binding domain-containing protein [Verrucomicrobiales bacterium]
MMKVHQRLKNDLLFIVILFKTAQNVLMKTRQRKKSMKLYQINLGILVLLMAGCGIRERAPISLLPSIGVKGGEVHPLNVDFADYPDTEGKASKEIESIKTEDYAIRKGDSLWKISRDRKTSVSILRQLNGISGDLIREGEVIKVPFVEGLDLTEPPLRKLLQKRSQRKLKRRPLKACSVMMGKKLKLKKRKCLNCFRFQKLRMISSYLSQRSHSSIEDSGLFKRLA